MTRSFDTIPNETDRSAELPKATPPVMSVCPFCGAIAEKNDGACQRCKMENTALTRQATRARVGPWYVMQSRNPSAPGMKCNTLLALIRKGQITPRSVIRGPTTFQLWRFAARVKGISREFGLCYSCGSEVQRTSTFCPRCSRSQELPPNADVLLENEIQSGKPVYREVKPPAAAPLADSIRPESPNSAPMRSATPLDPDPIRQSRPSLQTPSAAETMAELAKIPSPHLAGPELQSRPRQRPQEGVLTPRELAAAFSLQYDPSMDTPGSRRRRGRGKRAVLVVLLLMVISGAAAAYYYVPTVHDRVVAWIQDAAPSSASSPDISIPSSTPPSLVPDRQPDYLHRVAIDPPIAAAPKSSVEAPSPASNDQANVVPRPAPIKPYIPPPLPTRVAVPLDPAAVAAAANTARLRQSSGGDLDILAMQLRSNGMEAEHRQDLIGAQYYYQQVETLPRDHWPGDIDQLLKEIQKKLLASNFH